MTHTICQLNGHLGFHYHFHITTRSLMYRNKECTALKDTKQNVVNIGVQVFIIVSISHFAECREKRPLTV